MPGFEVTPMKDLRGYLNSQQVDLLLKGAGSTRNKLLLKTYWFTSARVSEVVGYKDYYHRKKDKPAELVGGLRPKDIVKEDDVLILNTLKRKKRLTRRVPVPHGLVVLLFKYIAERNIDEDERVFPITRSRVDQIIKQVGKRVGMDTVGSKKIHTHVLRHSGIVQWVRANPSMESLRKMQERVKHASINTTAGYLQFDTEEQKKEVERAFGKGDLAGTKT